MSYNQLKNVNKSTSNLLSNIMKYNQYNGDPAAANKVQNKVYAQATLKNVQSMFDTYEHN